MRDRRTAAGTSMFLVVFGWLAAPSPAYADDDVSLDLGGAAADVKPADGAAERSGRRLDLRRVAPGKFVQGSPATDVGHEPDESTRSVTLTRSFWIGKTPITRAQFARFVAETRHVTDAEKAQSGGMGWDPKTNSLVQKKEFSWRSPGFPQKDDDPVVLVTFGDANAFTAWASRKTGRRVRLPTEAEWEYVARAGTTTPWYGATKEEDALVIGWFRPNGSFSTHPVGQKKPNAWGIFDMTGNVQQWCKDVYANYPGGDATDPENATNTSTEPERRVLRGGSWLRDPKRGRSAARSKNPPGTRHADIGFRIAVDDDVAAPPGLGSIPADVAPAPLGIASGTPVGGADASAPAASTPTALPMPTRSNEGFPWSMVIAPFASATVVMAWVLARRGRSKAPSDVASSRELPSPSSLLPPRDVVGDGPVGSASTPWVPSTSLASASDVVAASSEADAHRASLAPAPAPSVPPRNAIVDQRESQSPFHVPPIPPEEPPQGPEAPTGLRDGTGAGELKAFDAWMAAAKAEASKATEARLAAAKALGTEIGPAAADPRSSTHDLEAAAPPPAVESAQRLPPADERPASPKPPLARPSVPRPFESRPPLPRPSIPPPRTSTHDDAAATLQMAPIAADAAATLQLPPLTEAPGDDAAATVQIAPVRPPGEVISPDARVQIAPIRILADPPKSEE